MNQLILHHCEQMDSAIERRAIEKWGDNGYQMAYQNHLYEEIEYMQISFCPFCGASLQNEQTAVENAHQKSYLEGFAAGRIQGKTETLASVLPIQNRR